MSQNNFQEQLQRANKELKQVLEDAKGRYVMLSKSEGKEGVLDNDERHSGVTKLLDIAVGLHTANINSE